MSDLWPIASDFVDAKLIIMPIRPFQGRKCSCEIEDCENAGKHPLREGWRLIQLLSDESLETWKSAYRDSMGLGWALGADHLVLDIDPRNGGMDSLIQLEQDIGINLRDICKSIVKTGGGGLHLYFKKDPLLQLGSKLPSKYAGIDIRKHGNFVVMPGSMHASGNYYEWQSASKSELEDMTPLPQAIIDMLVRVARIYSEAAIKAGTTEIDVIKSMLDAPLDPDMERQIWISIGMAIHSATGGSHEGLLAWDSWSSGGTKYKEFECEAKWHSFGNYSGPTINIGTLVNIAKSAGWEPPAQTLGMPTEELEKIKQQWAETAISRIKIPSLSDDSDIDLFDPPGLLGDMYRYADSCTPFNNNNLSLACAVFTLGSIIGHRYFIPGRYGHIRPNVFCLGVAGASTGKEATLGAAKAMMRAAGVYGATHLEIKSEKDLSDTMERNQYSFYLYDEFGEFLKRVGNAGKSGASHLEGVTGRLMQAFTAANGDLGMHSDRASSIKAKWSKELSYQKKISTSGSLNGEDLEIAKAKTERARFLLKNFEYGIPNPFMSMFTMSTPLSMKSAFTIQAVESGLLSRALVFDEPETNPFPKPGFKGSPEVHMGLEMRLKSVAMLMDDCPYDRVDSYQQSRQPLKLEPEAEAFISLAASDFLELAETQKENSLESLARRAIDYAIKLCILLSAEDGTVTLATARYAVKFIRHELRYRMSKVIATENMESFDKNDQKKGLVQAILNMCRGNGQGMSTIVNRYKSKTVGRELIESTVLSMVEAKSLTIIKPKRTDLYVST